MLHRPILPRGFLVGFDRAIYFPSGVILLCTMLLCGSYINVGTKGTLGVIVTSYNNTIDRLLHYFLLDNDNK